MTTHGDFQPRNWLHDDGTVKVNDFGRADLRPWIHDVVRLSHQQFLTDHHLGAAFYLGLGRFVRTPEEAGVWRLENLNQAVGTVVWAHQVETRSSSSRVSSCWKGCCKASNRSLPEPPATEQAPFHRSGRGPAG
ncbi:hypothetical protein AB0N65_16285 [Paenarthrobacter sp. NPDC089322]|uniref:hypothetical protein n=1 Tax=Paenarthrobacter sp. NPDC089322 TaxID=3155065 RepID=UPI003433E614